MTGAWTGEPDETGFVPTATLATGCGACTGIQTLGMLGSWLIGTGPAAAVPSPIAPASARAISSALW